MFSRLCFTCQGRTVWIWDPSKKQNAYTEQGWNLFFVNFTYTRYVFFHNFIINLSYSTSILLFVKKFFSSVLMNNIGIILCNVSNTCNNNDDGCSWRTLHGCLSRVRTLEYPGRQFSILVAFWRVFPCYESYGYITTSKYGSAPPHDLLRVGKCA